MDRRASNSRPEMGLTKFQIEMLNQKDEIVMTSLGWAMYGRRHPGSEA